MPYCHQLWQLYLCSFITGLGYGIYFNTNNVWLLELFGDKAGPILQLSGFVYGIGTILGPLLYQPYVTGEVLTHSDQNIALNIEELLFVFEDNKTAMNFNTTYLTLNSNQSLIAYNGSEEVLRQHKLRIPFLICGIIVIIGNTNLLNY